MGTLHLVAVDATDIQRYIFGSNRLRENVGGSYLVAQATGAWALECLPQPNNVAEASAGKLDASRSIEKAEALAAEALYCGGGNLVALVRDQAAAEAYIRQLSLRVLQEAPGLRVAFAHRACSWEASLRDAVAALMLDLAVQKRSQPWSAPLLGLGVTMQCRSTGLPAVGITRPIDDDPGYPASAEILEKLDAASPQERQPSLVDQRLHGALPGALPAGYGYPRRFDDLGGSKGDHNYIAVVHADGNDTGKRLAGIAEAFAAPEKNREYIQALRGFSEALQDAATAALQAVVKLLQDKDGVIAHPFLPEQRVILGRDDRNRMRFVPFRPIVFGGDDTTFVCDGRLGLTLATAYLEEFERETERRAAECGGKLSACAGVAIVKTGHPFARAYALAEDLCASAKSYRREAGVEGSCLDWHATEGGVLRSLREIREREWTAVGGGPPGNLTQRPLRLHPEFETQRGEWERCWPVVKAGAEGFWREASGRSRLKDLAGALRRGGDGVKQFRRERRAPLLPALPHPADMTDAFDENGYHGSQCVYLDALELAEWHLPLGG